MLLSIILCNRYVIIKEWVSEAIYGAKSISIHLYANNVIKLYAGKNKNGQSQAPALQIIDTM